VLKAEPGFGLPEPICYEAHLTIPPWKNIIRKGKQFFFEKKNQKTFDALGARLIQRAPQ
jgi:hypothetical protein